MTIRRFWWLFLLLVLGIVVIAIFAPKLFRELSQLSRTLAQTLNVDRRGFLAALVIFSGVVAYTFKKISQFGYGICEVLVAGATAVDLARIYPSNAELLNKWTALAGAAYIVARGLGNMSDGQDKKEELRKKRLPA